MRVPTKEFDMGLVHVEDLRKVYRVDQEKVVTLSRINLTAAPGEVCCILGTSGSGRSTLLNTMVGLEEPSKDRVIIDDVEITTLSEKDLVLLRQKNTGFVFQSYNLMPTLNAAENVTMPLMFRGISKNRGGYEVVKMLHVVRLGNRLLHQPTQMSGGQQQWVGTAHIFMMYPKVIFADEPAGNLDNKTTREVVKVMVGTVWEHQEILILVTHDQDITCYAD